MRLRLHNRNLAYAAVLAPLVVFTTAASASTTLPPRKPGLWQTTMVMTISMAGHPNPMGHAPRISAFCSDASSDAQTMKKMAGDTGKCAKFDIEISGDTYTMDSACPDPIGSGTMTTHGVITRQSDTSYHMNVQTVSTHMSTSLIGDSRWLGACPAGVAPGDFGSMENGQFVKQSNMPQAPSLPPPAAP